MIYCSSLGLYVQSTHIARHVIHMLIRYKQIVSSLTWAHWPLTVCCHSCWLLSCEDTISEAPGMSCLFLCTSSRCASLICFTTFLQIRVIASKHRTHKITSHEVILCSSHRRKRPHTVYMWMCLPSSRSFSFRTWFITIHYDTTGCILDLCVWNSRLIPDVKSTELFQCILHRDNHRMCSRICTITVISFRATNSGYLITQPKLNTWNRC